MILVEPSLIPKIDKYADEELLISPLTLMGRAGSAVANAVFSYAKPGSKVRIFAGKGNNGGDGYAAAALLISRYDVKVYDVFSAGQRTPEGMYFLNEYTSHGGVVEALDFSDEQLHDIDSADTLVDAVFGTGFFGELPQKAVRLCDALHSMEDKNIIAVDVPLGINSSDGRVIYSGAYHAKTTVTLGFVKTGLVSYPGKEYVGNIINDNIGLHIPQVIDCFDFNSYYIDSELAKALLPIRPQNSNKGSFGKLLVVSGSPDFIGAAHLSLEAALRGGVGLVSYLGERELCVSLADKLPEAVYKPFSVMSATSLDLDYPLELSRNHTAILVGCGSSKSNGLFELVKRLLSEDGAPLILDADAINLLAEKGDVGRTLISNSKRTLILTPHPLEFSRLSGLSVTEIQSNRLSLAKSFASSHGCILVLKGAGTVVTDGKTTFINSTGSSALAKAGSGDVLAGLLASLTASGVDPLSASALAVYLHGLAADSLTQEYSTLGVIPSDLPREIARQTAKLYK